MNQAGMMDALSDRDFEQRLTSVATETEALLDSLLATAPEPDERVRPERLLAAMRHGALGGGKRLRPFLVVETAALFAVPRARALMVGAALECVHCYSLVHDDLPAMDDDDLRRGRPTVHKAFDEATAILAGDALLTIAFDIITRDDTHPDPAVRVALVRALARASGLGGMAGGQMLDLAAEGRFGSEPMSQEGVSTLQAMKTGALLRFTGTAGALLGNATREQQHAVEAYAGALGEAFQIADDLLDLEGDPAVVGKSTGKDAAAGKATFVATVGPDGARARLAALVAAANDALAAFGNRTATLRKTAQFVADRRS
jgi:farnesyl diphosphate synthase